MKLHLNLSDPCILSIWEANLLLNPEWEAKAIAKFREIVKEQ